MADFEFKYAASLSSDLLQYAKPVKEEDKKYLEWHDLIDIKVPLFKDPSLLLGSRVPTPLHHRAPRNILSEFDEEWWNRTRRKVYAAQDYHCFCCGVHQDHQGGWVRGQLDCHEVYDIDWKTGRMTLKELVGLCKQCHSYIHFGRLFAQRDAGKIQDKTFYAIISHGNTVLDKAGLPQKNLDPTIDDNVYKLSWDAFHLDLTIEGKEQSFYSLYKDEEDLKAHY